MQQTLTSFERQLINRFQGGVDLTNRPFREMAKALDSEEDTVLGSVQCLLERGWLSRFGPLYNAERLGGSLVLAAMSVPDAKFDKITEQVNALAAVAHNYRRDHWLNMCSCWQPTPRTRCRQQSSRSKTRQDCGSTPFQKSRSSISVCGSKWVMTAASTPVPYPLLRRRRHSTWTTLTDGSSPRHNKVCHSRTILARPWHGVSAAGRARWLPGWIKCFSPALFVVWAWCPTTTASASKATV
ncbi:MAG: hypothetical protein AB2816_20965 [Candidatus Thiodiazotropha endolucinida]